LKTECSLKFNKADFSDLGVIVNSIDGRIMYDNRFLARLERVKEEVYMELLKESF
jgi:vacuolar-type H+-ATPase subunit E/Vma4